MAFAEKDLSSWDLEPKRVLFLPELSTTTIIYLHSYHLSAYYLVIFHFLVSVTLRL